MIKKVLCIRELWSLIEEYADVDMCRLSDTSRELSKLSMEHSSICRIGLWKGRSFLEKCPSVRRLYLLLTGALPECSSVTDLRIKIPHYVEMNVWKLFKLIRYEYHRLVSLDLGGHSDGVPNLMDIIPLTLCYKLRILRMRRGCLFGNMLMGNFRDLRVLDLRGSPVTHLTKLSECTSLEYIDLRGTKVIHIGSLSRFPHLRNLWMDKPTGYLESWPVWWDSGFVVPVVPTIVYVGNTLVDRNEFGEIYVQSFHGTMYGMEKMMSEVVSFVTRRRECVLHVDLSLFGYATNLRILSIPHTSVYDISVLSNCRMLEKLDVSDNRVHDITVLSECVNLKRLDISWTDVTNLGALRGLDLDTLIMEDLSVDYFFPIVWKMCREVPGCDDRWVSRGKVRSGCCVFSLRAVKIYVIPWVVHSLVILTALGAVFVFVLMMVYKRWEIMAVWGTMILMSFVGEFVVYRYCG